jgi:hypothetical protein
LSSYFSVFSRNFPVFISWKSKLEYKKGPFRKEYKKESVKDHSNFKFWALHQIILFSSHDKIRENLRFCLVSCTFPPGYFGIPVPPAHTWKQYGKTGFPVGFPVPRTPLPTHQVETPNW